MDFLNWLGDAFMFLMYSFLIFAMVFIIISLVAIDMTMLEIALISVMIAPLIVVGIITPKVTHKYKCDIAKEKVINEQIKPPTIHK